MTVASLVKGRRLHEDRRQAFHRDCADDEVSVDEITPKDTDYIVEQISEMNSLHREAGKTVARFRANTAYQVMLDTMGEEIRKTADGGSVA